MASFDFHELHVRGLLAVIHSSHTNHIFSPSYNTVEIWEVSMTSSNMIFEIKPLSTSRISSICPSRDGRRLLVGNSDGTVRMLNLEDLAGNQLVIQDTDVPRIIGFSPSRKMVATKTEQSAYIELRDTITWDVVGSRDVIGPINVDYGPRIAFSADDDQIAVWSDSLVTIYDMTHPENRLSFDPCPKGRSAYIRKVAFQTRSDLVVCTNLRDATSGLLQVWKLKGHTECTFSLDINIGRSSIVSLAPDGLTVIIHSPASCYSWNQNTAQFDRIHFTDEALLDGISCAYSPDGKLFACGSWRNDDIRVWGTRTGQLCGKPITMPAAFVYAIAFSPALNDQSFGDRLIALHCSDPRTITLVDVYTSYLRAQCWDPAWGMEFIRDGTKLVSYDSKHPIRIYDIVDFVSKYRNAALGYEPVPQNMTDGWVMGQEDELLFWVPLEHRRVLCLPHVEAIGGRPIKVDLSRFRYSSEWTECINQGWLKELEERGKEVRGLLE